MKRVTPSGIGLKVLAFNLLVVFLPVAGILYLDVYEAQLLEQQERGMVQQARLVAAALGTRPAPSREDGEAILRRLEERGDARIRVYDVRAALVVDSAGLRGFEAARTVPDRYETPPGGSRTTVLYKLGAWLANLRRRTGMAARRALGRVTAPARESNPPAIAEEVAAALAGKYGARVRPTPGQRSLTLNSAVPIRFEGKVIGAVVVSQSTYRILQALYRVRLRIFEIVVLSVLLAAALSIVVAATIVRPLGRLRRSALAFSGGGAPAPGFPGIDRRDEIGDLARALDDLTRRLEAHIRLLEAFAADVSHEFKNPLASIRTAAELLSTTEDAAERARFLELLTRDVDRLERLVSGVRELARIDAQLAHEPLEPVDVGSLVTEIVSGLASHGAPGPSVVLTGTEGRHVVRCSPDRLAQVFENILLNARSFAPAGTSIDVALSSRDGTCRIVVADRGPGLPPDHLERVFDRFFSYRPHQPGGRRDHAGLGLAIAQAIVCGYGGRILARNREGGGAAFEVTLPLAHPSVNALQFPAVVD